MKSDDEQRYLVTEIKTFVCLSPRVSEIEIIDVFVLDEVTGVLSKASKA